MKDKVVWELIWIKGLKSNTMQIVILGSWILKNSYKGHKFENGCVLANSIVKLIITLYVCRRMLCS